MGFFDNFFSVSSSNTAVTTAKNEQHIDQTAEMRGRVITATAKAENGEQAMMLAAIFRNASSGNGSNLRETRPEKKPLMYSEAPPQDLGQVTVKDIPHTPVMTKNTPVQKVAQNLPANRPTVDMGAVAMAAMARRAAQTKS